MKRHDGFALPTVLIASIIMMIVLLSSVSAAVSIRTSINEQYYNQLAKEGAEAGLARARACIQQDGNVATWSNNGLSLKPNTNCDGSVIAGADEYIYSAGNMRSGFTIGSVSTATAYTKIVSVGIVDLLRTSSGTVRDKFSISVSNNILNSYINATSVASGISETCGIIADKTYCWGNNAYGQLGNGNTASSIVPVAVSRQGGALLDKVDKLVAVGNEAACIVTTANEVFCMGNNSNYVLGDGTTVSKSVPTRVATDTGLAGKTITDITMNDASVCVVASGDVYCWGNGDYGRIGIGNTLNQSKPVRVSTIGTTNGLTVTKIASTAMARSTCAVAAGKAYCWGYNSRGELGDGTTTQRNSPTAVYVAGVLSGKTIVDISHAGGYEINSPENTAIADSTRRGHACAVTSDGGMYCWGSNQYGQMGQGSVSQTPQTQPIKVNGLLSGKTVVKTASSYGTPCALTDTNLLYCWGQNTYGTVGDGTSGGANHRSSPTAVAVLDKGLLGKTITRISGGVNRNCAIADAISYCWGRNFDGQIGDGTTIDRSIPTEATYLKKLTSVLYY